MFAFKGNKTEEGKCKKTGKNNAEKNEEKDRDLEKLEKKAVRLRIKEDTDSFSKFDFGISMFASCFLSHCFCVCLFVFITRSSN